MQNRQQALELDNVNNGKYAVVRITGGSGLLRKLTDLGIYPGSHLEVVSSSQRGGPILLSVKGSRFGLGRGMASKILVKSI